MTEPYPYYAVYELQGSAAEAARELATLEQEIVQRQGPARNGYRNYNLLRNEIAREIDKRLPQLVRQLGLDAPAVQVEQHAGGYPRAYNHFPHIAASYEPERFLMYCPIDYKGGHHVPAEAVPVPAEDIRTTDFGDQVHRELGPLSPPLLARNKAGTTLPADFDPAAHRLNLEGIAGYTFKVFIAGGSSLACVQDYLKRKEGLESAKTLLKAELEKLAPSLNAKELLGAEPGDTLKASCTFQTNQAGKTEAWVRIANNSKGGEAVALKDNAYFVTDGYSKGAFRIRPNTETPEGRKLGRLFDGLTSEPDLGQYWQLWNPTASGLKGQFHSRSAQGDRTPKLDTVRGVHYLVYLIDENAPKDHCNPPGGIPVSLAEYLWLKADLKDEAEFVRLPEPPQQLAHMRPIKAPAPAP